MRRAARVTALLHLEEDALAGAVLGGVDDGGDEPLRDDGHLLRTARVVAHPAVVHDVGDAVLEEDEDLGAVVDAEAVAGAQVLVDPDAHGGPSVRPSEGRTFDPTGARPRPSRRS